MSVKNVFDLLTKSGLARNNVMAIHLLAAQKKSRST